MYIYLYNLYIYIYIFVHNDVSTTVQWYTWLIKAPPLNPLGGWGPWGPPMFISAHIVLKFHLKLLNLLQNRFCYLYKNVRENPTKAFKDWRVVLASLKHFNRRCVFICSTFKLSYHMVLYWVLSMVYSYLRFNKF